RVLFRSEPGAGRELSAYLDQTRGRIVALVDGLEDLFQSVAREPRQQVALRALLQEVPEWLRQQSTRRIGLIIVIRRDLVQSAVPQNTMQLLSLYKSYALQ